MLHGTVRTPEILLPPVWPLPRSLATTYGISVDFSSSPYLDVSVQAVPRITLWIHVMLTEYCSAGFPHSEICGSMDMCSSPQLIAACHVLRRLPVPRHSPCALCSLTFRIIWANFAFLKFSIPAVPAFHNIAIVSRFALSATILLFQHVIRFSRSRVRIADPTNLLRKFAARCLRMNTRKCSMSPTLPDEQQSTLTSSRLGGDERNRTAGLLLARQALSQLSYTPTLPLRCVVVFSHSYPILKVLVP